MEEKKAGRFIILISFAIIICLSRGIWFFAESLFDGSNHENRKMAKKPILTLNNYGTFFADYTAYFNDNIQFRRNLVFLNSLIDYYVFDKSASKDVIKGKSGWLFYSATLPDYQRTNLYSEQELKNIKEDVIVTNNYMNDKGIEFVIFIGPNKNTIYGEYMPSYLEKRSEKSRTQQMVDYLRANTDVNIIFPTDELLKAKEKYPEIVSYFKLDTHWNYMGGFFASAPLLSALNVKSIEYKDVFFYPINKPDFIWNGYDEANMLGLASVLNEDVNYLVSNEMIDNIKYDGFVPDDVEAFNNLSKIYSGADDHRKVFLARDSFGEAITPYIAASFSEVYSRHRGSLTRSQIDEERPDIFIFEAVERSDFRGCFNYKNWKE